MPERGRLLPPELVGRGAERQRPEHRELIRYVAFGRLRVLVGQNAGAPRVTDGQRRRRRVRGRASEPVERGRDSTEKCDDDDEAPMPSDRGEHGRLEGRHLVHDARVYLAARAVRGAALCVFRVSQQCRPQNVESAILLLLKTMLRVVRSAPLSATTPVLPPGPLITLSWMLSFARTPGLPSSRVCCVPVMP